MNDAKNDSINANNKRETLPDWLVESSNSPTQKKDLQSPKTSNIGKYFVFGFGGALAFGTYILGSFILKPINRGKGKGVTLPYIPATNVQVSNVMRALSKPYVNTKNSKFNHSFNNTNLIDIGSGDGRLCIEATKQFKIQSLGIEINRPLVWKSRLNALRDLKSSEYRKLCKFKTVDLWKYNLKNYDNVCIFGVEQMMEKLDQKFHEELKPGTRIVVCRFPLKDREPVEVFGSGIDTVWLYFQE